MCGRYTYRLSCDDIVRLYRLTTKPPASNFAPNFNVAPTHRMPIIRLDKGDQRECAIARWDLIPYRSPDGKFKFNTFNARAETVRSSRTYKQSFERRRCIVPASSWYEWKREGEHKQPYAIRLKQTDFGFAGIWDWWKLKDGGEPVESFSIITTEANPAIAHLHDRMPRVLAPDQFEQWVQGSADDATKLLNVAQGEYEGWPVDKKVGSVKNNSPDLIEPL